MEKDDKGYSVITIEGTVWERLGAAVAAYKKEYGGNPNRAEVDARLMEGITAIEGIVPMADLQPGQVILYPG